MSRNEHDPERYWENEFRKLQVDTIEQLKSQCQQNAIEIAVIKTKIAMTAGIAGLIAGIGGTIIARMFLK